MLVFIENIWFKKKYLNIYLFKYNFFCNEKKFNYNFLCNDKTRHLFSVEAVPEDVHGDVEEVERTPGEEEHHTHLKGWQLAVCRV